MLNQKKKKKKKKVGEHRKGEGGVSKPGVKDTSQREGCSPLGSFTAANIADRRWFLMNEP